MTDHNYDIIIIGAGIIGSLIARELSRYQLRILLLEKESDVGTVTTAANTAIIHGGYDPVPGSLKASMNVAGNAMWDTLAGELNFAFDRCGDHVVATRLQVDPYCPDVPWFVIHHQDAALPSLHTTSPNTVLSFCVLRLAFCVLRFQRKAERTTHSESALSPNPPTMGRHNPLAHG